MLKNNMWEPERPYEDKKKIYNITKPFMVGQWIII